MTFQGIEPLSFSKILHPETDPDEEDDGIDKEATDGPGGTYLTKMNAERHAFLQKAEEAIDQLPAEGECLHGIMTGYYDLMSLLCFSAVSALAITYASSRCPCPRETSKTWPACSTQEQSSKST